MGTTNSRGHFPRSPFQRPPGFVDARLDRLVTAKGIAQLAAVIGRQFAYDVLLTVSQLDEATLQRELGRLVEAEIVYQEGPPQSTYVFKHALIQDAAYSPSYGARDKAIIGG